MKKMNEMKQRKCIKGFKTVLEGGEVKVKLQIKIITMSAHTHTHTGYHEAAKTEYLFCVLWCLVFYGRGLGHWEKNWGRLFFSLFSQNFLFLEF